MAVPVCWMGLGPAVQGAALLDGALRLVSVLVTLIGRRYWD